MKGLPSFLLGLSGRLGRCATRLSVAIPAFSITRRLRRKNPPAKTTDQGEVESLLQTPGSYTFKHDFEWAQETVQPLGESRIVVWRSVSTAMRRALVHPLLFGRAGLRPLFALENLAPDAFGRPGAYSTPLVTKPGAVEPAPGGAHP